MAVRERLATLLHRTGALDAALKVRARVRAPLVTILTYHHVYEPDSGYPFDPEVADATPDQFRRQLETVARHFQVIGIDELCRALDGGPLPPNPALITFDDGYRSCLEVAAPILRQVGLRAVFFMATSFISERRLYWWERIAYLVRKAPVERVSLTYPEPREIELRAPGGARKLLRTVKDTPGLDVERFLTELTRAARIDWDPGIERRLADELAGSRADLERELGRPVRAIAYPVGRPVAHLPHIRDALTAAGYQVGFTNGSGTTLFRGAVDRFDVRRIAIDRDISEAMFLGQMAIPPLGYANRNQALGYAGGQGR